MTVKDYMGMIRGLETDIEAELKMLRRQREICLQQTNVSKKAVIAVFNLLEEEIQRKKQVYSSLITEMSDRLDQLDRLSQLILFAYYIEEKRNVDIANSLNFSRCYYYKLKREAETKFEMLLNNTATKLTGS